MKNFCSSTIDDIRNIADKIKKEFDDNQKDRQKRFDDLTAKVNDDNKNSLNDLKTKYEEWKSSKNVDIDVVINEKEADAKNDLD